MKLIQILSFSTLILIGACTRPYTYNTSDIPPFEGLPKPDSDSGIQVHVAPFPVPANFEREWYMRLPIGNTEKIYVTDIEVKMRPGTHHFIAYPFANENDPTNPPIGVLRDQNLPTGRLNVFSNLNMNGFVLESTAPDYTMHVPAGYAIPFNANATLDFNSHYFNKTNKTLFGEVYMNLYTKPKSEIVGELKELIHNNAEILTLPPNKITVVEYTEKFEELTRIMILTSHSHKRGKKYEIYGVGGIHDGKLLYSNTDYVHPIINYYNTPLTIQKGDGLRSVITYENETNRTITFGVTSEDEMGITFGYTIKN